MEELQKQPLAFSSSSDLISATSRLVLETTDGALLNIEVFDRSSSSSSSSSSNSVDPSGPILLVLHGVCESAETLSVQAIVAAAPSSMRVCVLESEGHGLSSSAQGRCVCTDFDRLVNHSVEFVRFAVNKLSAPGTPTPPFFLTGCSMGGVLAIYAAETLSNDDSNRDLVASFRGVAPMAPAVGVQPAAVPSKPIVFCLSIISCLAPAWQVSLTPFEDPAHYNCPPDTKRNFSGYWPLGTSKMLLDVTSQRAPNDIRSGKLTLQKVNSVLVVVGGKDYVIPQDAVELLVENISSAKKELLLLPNAGHDMIFEKKSSKTVTDALFAWIQGTLEG